MTITIKCCNLVYLRVDYSPSDINAAQKTYSPNNIPVLVHSPQCRNSVK